MLWVSFLNQLFSVPRLTSGHRITASRRNGPPSVSAQALSLVSSLSPQVLVSSELVSPSQPSRVLYTHHLLQPLLSCSVSWPEPSVIGLRSSNSSAVTTTHSMSVPFSLIMIFVVSWLTYLFF